MKALTFLLVSVSAFAQTASYPAGIATDSQLKIQVNGVVTSLTQTMGTGQMTASVASCARIVPNTLATIDMEIVPITSCTGTTLLLSGRGFDNTTPTPHQRGAAVSLYIAAWHHNALKNEVEAIETTLGPNLLNVPTTTTTGYALDTRFVSPAAACASTVGGAGTVVISVHWNNMPSQSIGCPFMFVGNGMLQPGSGQTVTIGGFTADPNQVIFDLSLNGSVAFSFYPPILYPGWFSNGATGVLSVAPPLAVGFAGSPAQAYFMKDFGTGAQTFPTGIDAEITYSPASASSATLTAGVFNTYWGGSAANPSGVLNGMSANASWLGLNAGSLGTAVAVTGVVQSLTTGGYNTGTLTAGTTFSSTVLSQGGGAITTGKNFEAYCVAESHSTSSIGTCYGLYVRSPGINSSATIPASTAVYIEDQTLSGRTAWSIYSAGTTSSHWEGQFLAIPGSAAAPEYSFIGHTNYGLDYETDLVLVTAGTAGFHMDASRRSWFTNTLGIGTTTFPAAKVDIRGGNEIIDGSAGSLIVSRTAGSTTAGMAMQLTSVGTLDAGGWTANYASGAILTFDDAVNMKYTGLAGLTTTGDVLCIKASATNTIGYAHVTAGAVGSCN